MCVGINHNENEKTETALVVGNADVIVGTGVFNAPIPASGPVKITDENKDSVVEYLKTRFGLTDRGTAREAALALAIAQVKQEQFDQLREELGPEEYARQEAEYNRKEDEKNEKYRAALAAGLSPEEAREEVLSQESREALAGLEEINQHIGTMLASLGVPAGVVN